MGSRYRQIEVSTSSPEVLVARLLGRAVSSIQRARDADRGSAGAERAQALGKAVAVIAELRSALDLERGGEVARNLEDLYEFVNRRLLAASIDHGPEPLDEALRPLEIVSSAWHELAGLAPAGGER